MYAEDSTSLIRSIVLAAIVSPSFAIVFVALRFYTAKKILRGLRRDDWLILVGLAFSIAFSVSQCFHTKHGLGRHTYEIPKADKPAVYRNFMLLNAFGVNLLSNLAILFIKSSILVFYLRFSTSRRLNITIYVVLAIVIGYSLAGAFSFLYACYPIQKFWTFENTPGSYCIEADRWFGSLISLNVLTDAILLVLPFWLLKPMRAGLAQRMAIAAILGTGGFVLGVSVWRLVVTVQAYSSMDFPYRYGVNYLWLIIEINVAIICACLPCLRALVGRVMPSLMSITPRHGPLGLDTISVSGLTAFQEEQESGYPVDKRPSKILSVESSTFFNFETSPSRAQDNRDNWV